MQQGLQSLWMRLSIVEAKIQQEKSRLQTDPVRLALLDQMKTSLEEDIRTAEIPDLGPEMQTGTMDRELQASA